MLFRTAFLLCVITAVGGLRGAPSPRAAASFDTSETTVDGAFRSCMARCWSPRTSLLYGCEVPRVEKAASFRNGLLDWREGARDSYGAGMGDCAISCAVALSGCVDRWEALRKEGVPADDPRLAETEDWSAKLAQGLLNLASRHGYTGFVARGLCEEDGKSICSLSSIDQHTHWVHGLYRYSHAPMARPEILRTWRTRIAEVAARMERTVRPETDYNFGLCDGRKDPRGICRMWWPDSTNATSACRLPSIYAAAYDATGDLHWKRLYERLADKACRDAAFLEKNRREVPNWLSITPTYTLLQMNVSIEVLLGCERDPSRRANLLEGLRQSGREADRRAREKWRNPQKKWYGMAPDAELALAQLTAGNVPYDETNLQIFSAALGTGDARAWWSLKTAHLFAAYWRARLRGLVPADFKVNYPDFVTKRPVLRGVMLPGRPCQEKDLADLAAWGATLARYQMNVYEGAYDRDLDVWLTRLERDILGWARKYGILLVVDLHTPPGGRYRGKDADPNGIGKNNDLKMLYEEKYARAFVEVWRMIAQRLKGNEDVIYGYDLCNEPVQRGQPVKVDSREIQRLAAEAIRAIDPVTPIVVEADDWANPEAFARLSPLRMDNVIYQFHMYRPHELTHQRVGNDKDATKPLLPYPCPEKGWDKAFLRQRLQDVVAFQRRHAARILVGEFSCIAWTPGADSYLADVIDLFEEYGWDWSYHAFREWAGWSVEHTWTDPKGTPVPSADNPRLRALKAGLRR